MRAPTGMLVAVLLAGCASTPAVRTPVAAPTPTPAAPTTTTSLSTALTPTAAVATTSRADSSSLPVPGPSVDVRPVKGTGSPIAWADLPYRPRFPAGSPAPAGSPRWCRASDLAITEPESKRVIHNSAVDSVVLSFVARAAACALQGAVQASIKDADDTRTVVGWQQSIWRFLQLPADTFSQWPAVVVSPGHPAWELLAWNHVQCQGRGEFSVTLPHDGGTFGFAWPQGPPSPCTSVPPAPSMGDPGGNPDWSDHMLTVHPITSRTDGADADQPWTAVSEVLPLPRTVSAGATLHYQVQLASLPGHPLTLSPCPGYRQQLLNSKTLAVLASADHQLSCAGVPTITHVGQVFDMQLTVPASTPVGTKLTVAWQPSDPIIGGSDPVTGEEDMLVTVTS